MKRRELLKAAAAAGGLGWVGLRSSSSQDNPPENPMKQYLCDPEWRPPDWAFPSPPATPFAVPLYVPPVKASIPRLTPPPVPTAHQLWDEHPPKKFYEIFENEFQWLYHTDRPYNAGSWSWGFDGLTPGPTYHARYGEPILVRRHNALPSQSDTHIHWALPSTTSHLHNAHTASESDGYPMDFVDPGEYWDHHYACFPSGNDPNEKLTTLWYHDHRMDFTAANVYAGLAGFFLFFDEQDSGNENDPNPDAWHLPSGKYDVPLLLQDIRFDQNGQAAFDTFNVDGLLGDKYTVNRRIQPFLQVERRKYRLRILNGGPSRFYQLFLKHKNSDINFTVITGDGNFLTRPQEAKSIYLSVAQRCDVIIDFSRFNAGDSLYLQNRLLQTDGKGPTERMIDVDSPDSVMRFDVVGGKVSDPSRVPDCFRNLPPVDFGIVRRRRCFEFDYVGGLWTINGAVADMNQPAAKIEQGTAEIWTLRNQGKNWSHPIHSHFTEYILLEVNGVKLVPVPDAVIQGTQAMPGPQTFADVIVTNREGQHRSYQQLSLSCAPGGPRSVADVFMGGRRRDIATLNSSDELVVYMKWTDFVGKYVMHCHNVVHEDHAMMIRWDIVPPGQGDSSQTCSS